MTPGFWGHVWGAHFWHTGYWREGATTPPVSHYGPGYWGAGIWASRYWALGYWREGAATGVAPVVHHGALWMLRRRRRGD